jgi:hypothetical protein
VDPTTLHVLLVVFFATLVRSTFGFGEGLIAVPLLALVIPIGIAAPVVVLLSITIAAIVVAQDWRKIHMRSTGWLLAPTFVGIPLGVWLLTSRHPRIVKAALAVVIVAFSGYSLLSARLGKKPPELDRDSRPWLLGCGFLAGARRRLWHERASAGLLRSDAALVAAALSRHAAGIFSARQRGRDGRVLAHRALGSGGDTLLSAVTDSRAACDFSWPGAQSSAARRGLPRNGSWRSGVRRCGSAGAGIAALRSRDRIRSQGFLYALSRNAQGRPSNHA